LPCGWGGSGSGGAGSGGTRSAGVSIRAGSRVGAELADTGTTPEQRGNAAETRGHHTHHY
ncbi:hypothetical protein KZ287_31665, partial [Escherichia coli]|nr:hypothetical protein [Escherichia coli]